MSWNPVEDPRDARGLQRGVEGKMDKRPNKVSVLVLTMNEEVNIRRCLEGVKWADEIFVLDSGSTDRTLDVCREYTDKIYTRRFDNWSGQLNWALDNLPFRNDWLLNVDADEVVPDELAEEMIHAAETAPDDVTAYWLRRRFIFLGRWLKLRALYKTWILRMFRHKRLRFQSLVNPGAGVRGRKRVLQERPHPRRPEGFQSRSWRGTIRTPHTRRWSRSAASTRST